MESQRAETADGLEYRRLRPTEHVSEELAVTERVAGLGD